MKTDWAEIMIVAGGAIVLGAFVFMMLMLSPKTDDNKHTCDCTCIIEERDQ